MLEAAGIKLSFRDAEGRDFVVLDIAALDSAPGALTVVTGPSGSGKSTLLYALSGLQTVDAGCIHWAGTDIVPLGETARDRWRRKTIGMVFQDFHLIEELSPLDNVLVPAWFSRFRAGPLRDRAAALMEEFGVPASRRRLSDLSRGERQRVALARALLFDPPVILADEPTASLDREAGGKVIDSLRLLARDRARLVLAVSHDPDLIAAADRVLRLEHGRITETRAAA